MPSTETPINPDPRTTRAALAAVLTFIVVRVAAHFGLEFPPEVRDGIVLLALAYGLHRAADSGGPPQ